MIAAAVAGVLRVLKRDRNNSNESAAAMVVRNVRDEVADRSRNVLPSSSDRRNKLLRKPRENGRAAVVAVVVAGAGRKKPPHRIRMLRRSSRDLRASRVRPARRRTRVRILRSRGRMAERRVPRGTVRNVGDVFVVAGVVAVGDRRAVRRRRSRIEL
jgi:hypothetical protein